jgi:hypothetical protein
MMGYLNTMENKKQINTKLPMSSNKDIPENNQVGEEWRNFDKVRGRVILSPIRSLSVARQVQVSPVGSNILNLGGFFSSHRKTRFI